MEGESANGGKSLNRGSSRVQRQRKAVRLGTVPARRVSTAFSNTEDLLADVAGQNGRQAPDKSEALFKNEELQNGTEVEE